MKKLLYSIAFVYITCMSGCTRESRNEPEDHHEEENIVGLSSGQYQSAGITLGKVEKKNISTTLQVNGLLDVPPQNLVTVSAMMGGFIKSTKLLQGMRVKKGEGIVTIQNPEFIQLQQDYLDNKSKLLFAEQEYQREEELARNNISAKKTLQQVTANYQSLKAIHDGLLEKLSILGINPTTVEDGSIKSTVSIVSPISGYVTEVYINIGKYVNPQDLICEIVDTDHLHAELSVFEQDIMKVKEGQKIKLQLVNENDITRPATVYLINKKINEDRTVRVHAHLDKEDRNLLPNTYLKALIEVTDQLTTALPEEAIVSYGDKDYIFLKSEEHKHEPPSAKQEEEFVFKAIEVKKGGSQNGYTAVELPEGFDTENSEIVIKGAYTLLSIMNNTEEGEHSH